MKEVKYDSSVYMLYGKLYDCFLKQAFIDNRNHVYARFETLSNFILTEEHYKVINFLCDVYDFCYKKTKITYNKKGDIMTINMDFYKE